MDGRRKGKKMSKRGKTRLEGTVKAKERKAGMGKEERGKVIAEMRWVGGKKGKNQEMDQRCWGCDRETRTKHRDKLGRTIS